MAALQDAQQKGFELEALIFSLARLTFGFAVPAYSVHKDSDGVIRQVDGFFAARGYKYRVECKWRAERASQNDIVIFENKLDVAGVSGLFISMAGFTDPAVSQAREVRRRTPILLMDGDEVEAIFEKRIRFDELISKKRSYFDRYSHPYHRVVAIEDDT